MKGEDKYTYEYARGNLGYIKSMTLLYGGGKVIAIRNVENDIFEALIEYNKHIVN